MCGAHLRGFLPGGESFEVLAQKSVVGGGRRSSVFCPVCRSWDRERLIYLFLKNRLNLLAKGTRLLHVSPEAGLGGWLRSQPGLAYVTADLRMPGVDFHLDLTSLPFPDFTFDAVICNHVFEHIPDDARAMAEIFRVLRPGAWAILQVPVSLTLPATFEDFSVTEPAARQLVFGQHDHVRMYAMDYLARLRRAGFSLAPFRWRDNPKNYGGENNRFGLIEREIVFFAARPSPSVEAAPR